MPNRLAQSTSPYLLQHADNPVDWQEWGEEAFAEARERDVPILLSVGYAACHWCHVMAHESFEDEATAALMNEHFVNVKVDREERPDVDAVYMEATQALTGHGGWPMTVFLTADGEPFYAGTYFPPEPRHGMPSFPQLLDGDRRGVARQARRRCVDAAAGITAQLAERSTVGRRRWRAADGRAARRRGRGRSPASSTRRAAASAARRSSRRRWCSSSCCATTRAPGRRTRARWSG